MITEIIAGVGTFPGLVGFQVLEPSIIEFDIMTLTNSSSDSVEAC